MDENGKIKKGRNERPSGLSPVGKDGKINLTPTIQESDLQTAVVQAINLTLANRENMMATLQENIEVVIRQEDGTSVEGIEAKLLDLQKELLKLANSKKDYNSVADETDRLRN